MTPGKIYVSTNQAWLSIWSSASGGYPANKPIGIIEKGIPFILIESVEVGYDYVRLKILNHDGVVGFTRTYPLKFFKELTE